MTKKPLLDNLGAIFFSPRRDEEIAPKILS